MYNIDQIKSTLKERVAKGLNFGIESLEEVLSSSDAQFNDFILLKSKYSDLMHISSINTLPYDQIEIGLDRLRNKLLLIIDQLDHASLKKQQVEADLKVQDLSTRRTNFFKLVDIHFQNLEAIKYVETFYSESYREKVKIGREAIFEWFRMDMRSLRSEEDVEKVKQHFHEKFTNDIGLFEVYFKNIKHLLAYIQQNEVNQLFFLDTFKSLLSKYELAYIFYYAICDIDPQFKALVKKCQLIDPDLETVLIQKEHFGLL